MQNLTDRARKVLALAKSYANQEVYNTESAASIWMGLYKEGSGIGTHILQLHANRKQLEDIIEKIYNKNLETTKEILELATQAAEKLGHNYIGTEHLLLAALNSKGGEIFCEELKLEKTTVLTNLATVLGQHIDGAKMPEHEKTIELIKKTLESEKDPQQAIRSIKNIVNTISY